TRRSSDLDMNHCADMLADGHAIFYGAAKFWKVRAHGVLILRCRTVFHGNIQRLPSPLFGFAVAGEEYIDAVWPFNGAATITHNAPAPAGYIHHRAERVVIRVGSDGTQALFGPPREQHFAGHSPWFLDRFTGEKTRPRLDKFAAAGSF